MVGYIALLMINPQEANEGILAIQAGQNPRIIEQKLKSYLPDDNQEEVLEESGQLQREEQ